MTETERVLFVHAHPDDESISTGGTLATLVDRGANVTVVTCTRGERGEVIPAELKYALDSQQTLSSLRELELRKALGILGVTDHRYLGDSDARWAGRPPRRYVDSGMRWGAKGAEASTDFDPSSFTAAEFGDVAADIAAVIVSVEPDVVVSYNERGGYGHPDHIRAHQAARRAAEVYGVPFFAIEPRESSAEATLTVDVSPVLDRKKQALGAYPSQVAVDGDSFALSDGKRQPIDTTEKFRRLSTERERSLPFKDQSWRARIVGCLVAAAIGIATGALLTVYHQESMVIAGATVQTGLIAAIVLVLLLEVGLRLAFQTRVVAAFAAVGVVVSVAALSVESTGGTVLVPNNWIGVVWSIAPTAIALVVVAWPQIHRRPTDKIEGQGIVKGPSLQ
ncbi:MAG: N-acetyl-D-myo-inositol-2-amino-2-deoxy-alpha-D-glucopyranoside deacetylase [Actinomycetota bacterium]|jgi:N-acetyl-1-D-myo-inositol-2-amino-2-deoxy-alpha-D-glucopyranoside deacetylase|nr:N-acetyl-D-myo-inositol-2-amino-2-deoxy-alpha-D-glucopyranoside deacetylase [Actinomycetota bacterium]